MEPGLRDLLRQTVAIKAWLRDSTDGYGSPIYTGTATTYAARVVAKPQRLFSPTGAEIVATHLAWVDSTGTVGTKDQVTILGTTYAIVGIERPTDELGHVHHNKLYLESR